MEKPRITNTVILRVAKNDSATASPSVILSLPKNPRILVLTPNTETLRVAQDDR
jgi:hypothetical protein